MPPLPLLLAVVTSVAGAGVRIVGAPVVLKNGALLRSPDAPPPPPPRTRPCPDRDAAPSCRLIVYDLT